ASSRRPSARTSPRGRGTRSRRSRPADCMTSDRGGSDDMRTLMCIAVAILVSACSRTEQEKQAWDRGWQQISEGGKDLAHAGEIAIERARDVAIRAYHKAEPVVGRTGKKLEDTAIAAAVKTRLIADPDTHASGIEVSASGGTVTLAGHVPSSGEAAEA